MAILGAWTSISDCYRASNCSAYTGASKAPYVAEGINIGAQQAGVNAVITFPPTGDFWLTWYSFLTSNSDAGTTVLWLFGTDGTPLFRILQTASTPTWELDQWSGSAWTTVAGPVNVGPYKNILVRWELRLKIADSGGQFILYVGGAPLLSFTGDTLTTAITQVSKMQFTVSYSNSLTEVISAIILADEPTFDFVFSQALPTGNGGQTAWTNAFTEVDETGINDLDFIASNTASQVETDTFPALNSALNLMDVAAVVMATRARVGASGPQNIAVVNRQASTDTEMGNLAPVVGQFVGTQTVSNTNPVTSTAWNVTTVNAYEFGVKSKA